MLFNSYTFVGFYTIVLLAYLACGRRLTVQNGLLLIASYVFYAAWDYRFLTLIVFSTTVDFIASRRIEALPEGRSRRAWLGLSLTANLGLLAAFKYAGFAVDSFCELMAAFGWKVSAPMAEVILPVGISFYTFQTLSYTIDVYRRRISACRDPLAFAVYVAFFPQLVAGPIERASHFLPQVLSARKVLWVDVSIGTQFVLLGYFYKVVLADSIAPLVDQFYDSPDRYGGSIAWLATLGFAVQIYGDFAGYSLIARGVSRWMGFRLISNFRQPYLASSPRDFWTRWHRSLSMWLRRYLYFELGGSRHRYGRTCLNLMVTMLLGGLWHGASWNFVLWGAFHGVLLCSQHLWMKCRGNRRAVDRSPLPVRLFQTIVTFGLIGISWVLFRCQSVDQIQVVFSKMFVDEFTDPRCYAMATPILLALTLMMMMDLWRERRRSELVLLRTPELVRWSIYVAMVVSIVSIGFRPTSFLYFQF